MQFKHRRKSITCSERKSFLWFKNGTSSPINSKKTFFVLSYGNTKTILFLHCTITIKTKKLRSIPLASASRELKDGSQLGHQTTRRRTSTSEEALASNVEEREIQTCLCGWREVTSEKGPRIRQGGKRRLKVNNGSVGQGATLSSISYESSQLSRVESSRRLATKVCRITTSLPIVRKWERAQ